MKRLRDRLYMNLCPHKITTKLIGRLKKWNNILNSNGRIK